MFMKPLLLSVLATAATVTAASAVTYTDRATFEAATTIDYVEDFESLGNATITITGPTMLPSGLTVSSESNDLFVVGPGQSTNPTTAIGSNSPIDNALFLDFGGSYMAFGADMFQNNGGGGQTGSDQMFSIEVYLGATLVDMASGMIAPNGGGFLGIITNSLFDNAIVKASPVNLFEVVDNVTLGDAGAPVVPLPAGLPLLLTAFGGLAIARAKKKSA